MVCSGHSRHNSHHTDNVDEHPVRLPSCRCRDSSGFHALRDGPLRCPKPAGRKNAPSVARSKSIPWTSARDPGTAAPASPPPADSRRRGYFRNLAGTDASGGRWSAPSTEIDAELIAVRAVSSRFAIRSRSTAFRQASSIDRAPECLSGFKVGAPPSGLRWSNQRRKTVAVFPSGGRVSGPCVGITYSSAGRLPGVGSPHR